MKKALESLKVKAELAFTQLSAYPNSSSEAQIQILCGDSIHTASSEPYFSETAYDFSQRFSKSLENPERTNIHNVLDKPYLISSEPIVLNEKGKCVNILPLTENKKKFKYRGIAIFSVKAHIL
jgi:hypothetical protein